VEQKKKKNHDSVQGPKSIAFAHLQNG